MGDWLYQCLDPQTSSSNIAHDEITSEMDVEYEPAGPRPIKKLSKDVVNQIAAAEVRSGVFTSRDIAG